jgi:hypothetical protein
VSTIVGCYQYPVIQLKLNYPGFPEKGKAKERRDKRNVKMKDQLDCESYIHTNWLGTKSDLLLGLVICKFLIKLLLIIACKWTLL